MSEKVATILMTKSLLQTMIIGSLFAFVSYLPANSLAQVASHVRIQAGECDIQLAPIDASPEAGTVKFLWVGPCVNGLAHGLGRLTREWSHGGDYHTESVTRGLG